MIRVYTTGVFDLFHVGHLNIINKAKEFGDYLIVGVHTDEDVETYKRRPVIPLEERMEIIRALKIVDEVIVAPLTPNIDENFYKEHKIDIHVAGNNMEHMYELPERLGIMRYVERHPGVDTSDIIERIKEMDQPEGNG